MTHVITSNRSEFRSFREPSDNLIFVHRYEIPIYTTSEISYQDRFDVYISSGIGIPDEIMEYMKTLKSSIQVTFFDVPGEGLDSISSKILELEKKDSESDSIVAIASDPNFSKLATSWLNRIFKTSDTEISALNLIQYMGVTNCDAMVKQIQFMLGVDNVYPNDLIAFSFAVHRALGGYQYASSTSL